MKRPYKGCCGWGWVEVRETDEETDRAADKIGDKTVLIGLVAFIVAVFLAAVVWIIGGSSPELPSILIPDGADPKTQAPLYIPNP